MLLQVHGESNPITLQGEAIIVLKMDTILAR